MAINSFVYRDIGRAMVVSSLLLVSGCVLPPTIASDDDLMSETEDDDDSEDTEGSEDASGGIDEDEDEDEELPEPTDDGKGDDPNDTGVEETALSHDEAIQPLWDEYCGTAICHDAKDPAGNLDLTSGVAFANIVNKRKPDGTVFIMPGDPDASVLWERLVKPRFMPPNQGFPDDAKETIRQWILDGANP